MQSVFPEGWLSEHDTVAVRNLPFFLVVHTVSEIERGCMCIIQCRYEQLYFVVML